MYTHLRPLINWRRRSLLGHRTSCRLQYPGYTNHLIPSYTATSRHLLNAPGPSIWGYRWGLIPIWNKSAARVESESLGYTNSGVIEDLFVSLWHDVFLFYFLFLKLTRCVYLGSLTRLCFARLCLTSLCFCYYNLLYMYISTKRGIPLSYRTLDLDVAWLTFQDIPNCTPPWNLPLQGGTTPTYRYSK